MAGPAVVLDATSGTLITVLAVVVTVNAVNFVDGLDGLAAGVVGIAAARSSLFSYILAVQHATRPAATPALSRRCWSACAPGFLAHNFNPARIFMGDSGSMLIGLLLAAVSITLDRPGRLGSLGALERAPCRALLPLLLPLAVLAVPFADLLLAVLRRTRARRSPFAPDKQHLHHRLLEIGHSPAPRGADHVRLDRSDRLRRVGSRRAADAAGDHRRGRRPGGPGRAGRGGGQGCSPIPV